MPEGETKEAIVGGHLVRAEPEAADGPALRRSRIEAAGSILALDEEGAVCATPENGKSPSLKGLRRDSANSVEFTNFVSVITCLYRTECDQ